MSSLRKMFLIIAIFLISIFISYMVVRQYYLTHFSCSGFMVVVNGGDKAEVKLNSQFNGDHGEMYLEGTVYSASGESYLLNESMLFTFTRHKNIYLISNGITTKLANDTISLSSRNNLFFPYFSNEKISFELEISKEAPNGFLMMRGGRPVLFCEKN